MGHKGPKASDIAAESNIFEDMHFGKCHKVYLIKMAHLPISVVHADPKSRTGQEDKKQLVTMCAYSYFARDVFGKEMFGQDHCSRRQVMECRQRSRKYFCRIWRHNKMLVLSIQPFPG